MKKSGKSLVISIMSNVLTEMYLNMNKVLQLPILLTF